MWATAMNCCSSTAAGSSGCRRWCDTRWLVSLPCFLVARRRLGAAREELPHVGVLHTAQAFPCGSLAKPDLKDMQYMATLLRKIEELAIPAPAPIEQRWTSASDSVRATHSVFGRL